MAKIDLNEGSGFAAAVPRGREQWLDWCWTRNLGARERGWRLWLYVTEVGGKIEIKALSMDEAADVWALMDDKPLVAYGWTNLAVRKFIGLVTWRMQNGMIPDAWMAWSVEGRAQRRRDWIEAELAKNPNRG